MTQRILIMGLPGSGKTTIAEQLKLILDVNNKKVVWLNADCVRAEFNDWDFSEIGRIRQSRRMYELSTRLDCDFVIADFVAPLPEMRDNFSADIVVWMDTIVEGRFEDTNRMFVPPEKYDYRILEKNSQKWAAFIATHLLKK